MSTTSKGASNSDTVVVLDLESALDRIDGDRELYDEVVEVFIDDTPRQLTVLEEALGNGDKETVRRQAHSLKSAAANIGGEALRSASSELEEIALEADDEVLASAAGRF